MRLQPRDFAVLRTLGEVSLLDTLSIARRFWPDDTTQRACRRRLKMYKEHGLTQQVHLDLSSTGHVGRFPTIHRLLPYGADVVEQETGVRPLRCARSDPPKSSHTILHRLGMSEIMISLNDACELMKLAYPRWILEYDINPGARINSPAEERFRLRFDYHDHAGVSCTCWSDAWSLLTFQSDKKDWNLALCWEYDRSTEGHSQIAGKMPGYEKLLASNSPKLIWPQMQGLRIFFVLQSVQRLQNVCRTICHSSAAPYVRLSTAKEVKNPTRILTARIWRTVGESGEPGESRSILPS